MKELTVFAKDRVGLLADITEMMGKNGINIEFLSGEAIAGIAVLHMTFSNEMAAASLLERAGFTVISSDILVLKIPNKPGEIGRISRMLSDEGINIQNIYFMGETAKHGFFAVKVDRMDDAKGILKKYVSKSPGMGRLG
ncbi:ACT domain-containing protein [Candidatus Micrarchaeota archaeon]|nr:ACT domain-containing protein [Candidatus Micrarchaeota archaeon]